MPLHGKIVVIKRSGGDGPELPLTASCLFGRKPDSDIRIQLPQVSKEHCRIDFNENKEVILTNLSAVNPTHVNGEPLQQAERLKHGDVITIIDRSFRFEYPPTPTPKKRSSLGRKSETLKVLQAQQLGDSINVGRETKNSDDDHGKDGSDHNISHCLDETVEGSKQDNDAPFSDLYQMIKKSLDIKTPLKSSDSRFQTPSSKFCTPKLVCDVKSVAKNTPKKDATGEDLAAAKKQRRSSQNVTPNKADAEECSSQPRRPTTPQKFTVSEVIDQVVQTPKSPKVRSREATPAKSTAKVEGKQTLPTPQSDKVQRRSPRDPKTGKVMSQKRKSGELNELPAPQMKRKRVSFGGHLSPEFFDKKLPPDSPLCKGATPRRSLCISKTKQSLLRRASVIGLLKETDQEHSDAQSPLKSGAQSPAKKSPKPKSTSPRASASEKKSPKPKTPSPKSTSPRASASEKKSPKSRSTSPKTGTRVQKSPKPTTPSPKTETPGKKTPKAPTPSLQKSQKAASPGRKSASSSPAHDSAPIGNKSKTNHENKEAKISKRFSTPGQLSKTAPSADKRRASLAVTSLVSVAAPAVTPSVKVQTPTVQGRFSVSHISTPSPVRASTNTSVSSAHATPKIPLKRTSMKKTPKSAAKMMKRRSGISRASMKAMSFADIVKFGKTKIQVAALAQRSLNKKTRKTVKKTVPKPQTPAKKLMGFASTGHAASPATIVVGRALKQKVVQPTGAPPTIVFNTALLKKNMKVDEDLSGVSEMFKTPMNKSRQSVVSQCSAAKTPVVEQSILTTPEGTGEMVVSPMSVASVVRGRAYNSEAVQRLLSGHQDDSISEDIPPLQIDTEESAEQTEECVTSVTTPKPAAQECLTGVMKTPKQKGEPVEDFSAKILITPKQKPEQPDCLTDVKRIIKTQKMKSEPIEDLRGKILKTPKQKPAQQECLTGVKRLMKTPKQKAEPVEDLRGKLLITPKQKTEQKECLTAVKRIMRTPKERSEPVEEHFGIKRLMTSPRVQGNPPVEDFEGLQELMEEPVTLTAVQAETIEVQDEVQLDSEPQATKVEEPALKEPQVIESSVQAEVLLPNVTPNEQKEEAIPEEPAVLVPVREKRGRKAEVTALPTPKKTTRSRSAKSTEAPAVALKSKQGASVKVTEAEVLPEVPAETQPEHEAQLVETPAAPLVKSRSRRGRKQVTEQPKQEDEPVASSEDVTQTEGEAAVMTEQLDDKMEEGSAESEKPETENVPEVESETVNISEPEVTAVQKKTIRGRKAKTEFQASEEADEPSSAPVRGRRGKKAEATSVVRKTTRGRNVGSSAVVMDAEASEELVKVLPKPKRGAKTVAPEVLVVELALPGSEESTEISEEQVKVVPKPKRGAKTVAPEVLLVEPALPVPEESTEISEELVKVLPKPKRGAKTVAPEVLVVELALPVSEESTEISEEQVKVVPKPKRGAKTVAPEVLLVEPALPVPEESTEISEEQVKVVPKPKRGAKTVAPEVLLVEPALPVPEESTEISEEQVKVVPKPKRGAKTVAPEAILVEPALPVPEESTEISEEQVKVVPKPKRGAKTVAPEVILVEPALPVPEEATEISEEPAKDEISVVVIHEENETIAAATPQEPKSTVAKPRRGRKPKTEAVQQEVPAEQLVVLVEMTHKAQPPVRARRGRNAQHTEENLENEPQEPVQKMRRGRKQTPMEPQALPEEAVASQEPVKINAEEDPVVPKPKRGGKTKNISTVPESSENPDNITKELEVSDKPKRGRAAKLVKEVAKEEQEGKSEPEKKPRGRGVKTALKDEGSEMVPAKRARRGVANVNEETRPAETIQDSEPAPVVRGRRGLKKPENPDNSNVVHDSCPVKEEPQMSKKRAVKWKDDVEVHEIPKVTPKKATRGRKPKLDEQNDTEDVKTAEEEDLSEKVVEPQPAKRGRRGAKAAEESTSTALKAAQADTLPKTRRGRSAKK